MTTLTRVKPIALDYVKTIGLVNNGYSGRGFTNPCDLAIGKDGRIFVQNRTQYARSSANRVGIMNLDEDYLGEFGYGFGSGDGQTVSSVAIAFDSAERLHVTDEYNHRVTIFDTAGKYLGKWGEFGSGPGQVNGPAGIAIDRDDNVYLVDQHNNRIQKFTADGKPLLQWGQPGSGPGQFNLPWGLTLDAQGNVYVADWRNDRVQKFTADGQFLASFGTPGRGDGQFSRPAAVAVDPEGYIYVADWGNERVQVLNPDGSFALKLLGQATVSKWAAEFFSANSDELRGREQSNLFPALPEHLSAPWHVSSQTEPYFWGPVSVKLDNAGRLYVLESNRHRFQIYQKRQPAPV